jgi:hypothetical protein
MSRNVSSWQQLLSAQIANNDLVPLIDVSAEGRDKNKVATVSNLAAKILASLPRASEIDSLFAAAPVGSVPRKKADGTGIEYALPSRLLGTIINPASITGTTNETLFPESIVVPANTLKSGSVLIATAVYSCSFNTNSKTYNIKIAGNTVLNFVSASTNMQSYVVQRFCFCQAGQVLTYSPGAANSYSTATTANNAFALNYAIDNTITFSGQLANTADTLTLQAAAVKVL